MSNVIIFPAVRVGPRGRWWYGGRGFKTKDALQASSPLLTESALLSGNTTGLARR